MHPIYMKGRIKVKNAKKHFSRALTLLLSVLFIFQSVSVPAFAAENPTENIETMVENPLQRQDGVTNRKFAILQGALWCKGYCPGYNLYETADGTIV